MKHIPVSDGIIDMTVAKYYFYSISTPTQAFPQIIKTRANPGAGFLIDTCSN